MSEAMSPRSADEIRADLPVHYFDCDRFQVYDYAGKFGNCDCTATADVESLLDRIADLEGQLTASNGLRSGLMDALRDHRCQTSAV